MVKKIIIKCRSMFPKLKRVFSNIVYCPQPEDIRFFFHKGVKKYLHLSTSLRLFFSLNNYWNQLINYQNTWPSHGSEMCVGQVCWVPCAGSMVAYTVLFCCPIWGPCGTDPRRTPSSFHLWPCVVSAGRSAVRVWIQRIYWKKSIWFGPFSAVQNVPVLKKLP